MNEWKLEKMSAWDLEEVITLERELFQKEAWSRGIFEQELSQNYSKYWVLRVKTDNSLVGYAGAYFILPEVEISNIAVSRMYQGRGYSRILMDEILTESKALLAESIFLEVDTQNKSAMGLYEKYGFEKIAIRKNYYGANRDAFVMRLKLRGDT